MAAPIIGRQASIFIGDPPRKLTWKVMTEIPVDALSTTMPGYAHLDLSFRYKKPGAGDGGYLVPIRFMHGLRKIDAYWRRRERKAWKRYQRQKRKQ